MYCYINILIIISIIIAVIIIAIYLWITNILQNRYILKHKNKFFTHIYCYIDIKIFKTIKQQKIVLYSYILYILH